MEDKKKRKSDKITKQSFALLQRIKQRKERQKEMMSPVEENYIEDLYLKIVGKCSPHFNKMETSNDILNIVNILQKEGKERNIEIQLLRNQCGELKEQVGRFKDIQGEVARVKTLNQEISLLEKRIDGLNQEIKQLRQAKMVGEEQSHKLKKECEELKSTNEELQDIVEKLSAELETIANQSSVLEQPPTAALSSELQSMKVEVQQFRNQNQQLAKDKSELIQKIYRLEKEVQTRKGQVSKAQSSLKPKMQKLNTAYIQIQYENKELKQKISFFQNQKGKSASKSDQHERTKKDLQTVIEQLTNIKVQKSKNQSEYASELLNYQNQTFEYLQMIRSLNKNAEVREGELGGEIKILKTQIVHIQEKHKGEIDKKEQLFQKVFTAKNSLQKTVKSKDLQINQLKDQISSLKGRDVQTKGQAEKNVIEAVKHKQAQIEELKRITKTLKQEVEELSSQQLRQQKQFTRQQIQQQIQNKLVRIHSQKLGKNMETIQELNHELTEAYNNIRNQQMRIKQLEDKSTTRSRLVGKQSPPKQRSRSIKKITGMFGF